MTTKLDDHLAHAKEPAAVPQHSRIRDLVTRHYPLALKIAWRTAPRAHWPACESEAGMALFECARRHGHESDPGFQKLAEWRIHGAVIDCLRRVRREERRETALPPEDLAAIGPRADARDERELESETANLRRAMADLDEADLELLRLRYEEEVEWDAIVAKLGTSSGTIRRREGAIRSVLRVRCDLPGGARAAKRGRKSTPEGR